MKIHILASGSKGNCCILETEESKLMIDCGLGRNSLMRALGASGVDGATVNGILITHCHSDHVDGLKTMIEKWDSKFYSSPKNIDKLSAEKKIEGRRIPSLGSSRVCDWRIEAFPVSHDCIDPIGFVIERDEKRIGFIPDCGYISKLMLQKLYDIHTLIIECNYNEDMLAARTDIPDQTKSRISSMTGHLSDRQCSELAAECSRDGHLKNVILTHLSERSNHPDLARDTALKALRAESSKCSVHVAEKNVNLCIEI